MAFSPLHGSESSWRPSDPIGVNVRLPFGDTTYEPCCHCIIPLGHDGSVAVHFVSRRDHIVPGRKRLTVGQGAVVRFLIVSLRIERVGDAGEIGLMKLVLERIVKSLNTCVSDFRGVGFEKMQTYRTSHHLARLGSPCPNQVIHARPGRDHRQQSPGPNHDACRSEVSRELEKSGHSGHPFRRVGTTRAQQCWSILASVGWNGDAL